MSFGWIDAGSLSINTLLLFDRWILRVISQTDGRAFIDALARVLSAHPSIYWYFVNACPESSERFEAVRDGAPEAATPEQVRQAEIAVLDALDWAVVYVYPELMEELDYIKYWRPERLLSMADFTGRVVLDIGSGTGRLALAAAPVARWVYASEPVDRLRAYLREKCSRLGIDNVYVVDGTVEKLPFPDEAFDIVCSGHVVGDHVEAEFREISRVTRPGGCILDCPGEDDRLKPEGPNRNLLALGFEYSHYRSERGGDVYRYIARKPGA